MSKSKGNVVPVDDMVDQYGADTARLFILFIGPPETGRGVERRRGGRVAPASCNGVWRLFDERVQLGDDAGVATRSPGDYDAVRPGAAAQGARRRSRRVTDDIARFHFNTAVSAIMELVNAMTAYTENHGVTPVLQRGRPDPGAAAGAHRAAYHRGTVARAGRRAAASTSSPGRTTTPRWPPRMVITLVVQVNGKVRDRIDSARRRGRGDGHGARPDQRAR